MSQQWFRASLALACLCLLPLTAHAEILWRGDFETGDLSQWDRLQLAAADRLQVVPSPVREGAFSLRVAVANGDDPIGASGHRNELIYFDEIPDGEQVFYRWSTFFPSSYPSTGGWQIFSQFHHSGCCGSPPVEFYVKEEQLHLRVGGERGRILWSAPLQRAVWQDFVLQVRWSADPGVGRVALWHQGTQVLAPEAIATRYPGEGTYFKLGLYRDAGIKPTGVLFHDDVMIATELDDVLPPAVELPETPGQEDEGTHGGDDDADHGDTEAPPFDETSGSGGNETGDSGRLSRWTNQPGAEGCAAAPAGPLGALFGVVTALCWLRRRRRAD